MPSTETKKLHKNHDLIKILRMQGNDISKSYEIKITVCFEWGLKILWGENSVITVENIYRIKWN